MKIRLTMLSHKLTMRGREKTSHSLKSFAFHSQHIFRLFLKKSFEFIWHTSDGKKSRGKTTQAKWKKRFETLCKITVQPHYMYSMHAIIILLNVFRDRNHF